MNTTWLDDTLKHKIIWSLNKLIKEDKVDKPMIRYLHRINKLNGVCSVQCCGGHKNIHNRSYILITVSRDFAKSLLSSPYFWKSVSKFKNFWFWLSYPQPYYVPYNKAGMESTNIPVIRFEWQVDRMNLAMIRILNILECVA